ncbi:hypothetical protein QN397_15640 [Variovorax sp. RTB1]|uniref:hypothetical protein n=1 Tax=Variovorax sp. RTB1 TaxID=3048631 RepID=UPI002B22D20A|nr:hypothetical protein [Variovorax sp. RTB1]MEB0112790.1 hypothetical protein [Variovorax sp. RTB1]
MSAEIFYAEPGSTALSARVLLEWLATRAVAPLAATSRIALLRKSTVGKKQNTNSFLELLGPDDLMFLEAAWAMLPGIKNATRAEWPKYQDAFAHAIRAAGKDAPDWSVQAQFEGPCELSERGCKEAYKKHVCALGKLIKGGEVHALRADGPRAVSLSKHVLLPIEDVRKYLELCGFAFEFGKPPHLAAEPLAPMHEWLAMEAAKVGRYTLERAAEILKSAAGERKEAIQPKLEAAAKSGLLPVYEPGQNARRECDDNMRVRPFYDEAFWDDLNHWFKAHTRITYRFPAPMAPSPAQAAEPPPAPLQRITATAAQDAAILSAIRAKGLDPLALPKNEAGQPGPKAEIRSTLDGQPPFIGSTIFGKAWQRLRQRGEIVDVI